MLLVWRRRKKSGVLLYIQAVGLELVRGGAQKRVCRLRRVLVVRSMIQDGVMCWTNDCKMGDGWGFVYFVFFPKSKENRLLRLQVQNSRLSVNTAPSARLEINSKGGILMLADA